MKNKQNKLSLAKKFPLFVKSFFKRETPILAKGLILLTFLYVILPTDILPDFLGPLGFVDDVLLLPLMINTVVKLLPTQTEQELIN